MKASEILIAARAKIADRDNWFGGGKRMTVHQMCAVTSLTSSCALTLPGSQGALAKELLGNAMGNVADDGHYYWMDIINFNDTHTHAEVIAAFDRAITMALAEEEGGNELQKDDVAATWPAGPHGERSPGRSPQADRGQE